MRSLYIAATGMAAQQTQVDVIANNIANVNTTAFKRSRAEFTDLLYQSERRAGLVNMTGGNPIPEGVSVGLGVRTAGVRNLHLQGAMTKTGNSLDVAFNGRGWFQVSGPDGETLYTRAGAFNKSATGQIVTLDGYAVQPGMVVPAGATEIVVNESGEIFARVEMAQELTSLGVLSVVDFPNEVGLEALGGNLFRETAASGSPVTGVPGADGFGVIKQGYLEASNVDPVKEITELISSQRAYEMNSKVIQAADEMYGTISKGLR
ncbi:MAG TPA: flagellar basal-body rod protein FlgG [Hyphomicrobium sp.]|nr:flagellar basal-body rod protein FlgG [Hyphomicrobium sp.]